MQQIETSTHDITLSTILLVILGINAAENISIPEFLSHVKNISLASPVIPPYTYTAIGVPISGATTLNISPVIIAVFILAKAYKKISVGNPLSGDHPH